MKWLALGADVQGVTDATFTQELLTREAAEVWKMYQAGIIREAYFRTDREDAVLVLECADRAEAEQALASLPLVNHSLITFDLIPLKAYPGFERLFGRGT
jgi:muconolactone delta-isomerase